VVLLLHVSPRASILTDKVDFGRSYWKDISGEARDLVEALLQKDPAMRPSAKQALKHPWLRKGTVSERSRGKQLSLSIVQRIQVRGVARDQLRRM
jgi:calcium-dependent protein kinase